MQPIIIKKITQELVDELDIHSIVEKLESFFKGDFGLQIEDKKNLIGTIYTLVSKIHELSTNPQKKSILDSLGFSTITSEANYTDLNLLIGATGSVFQMRHNQDYGSFIKIYVCCYSLLDTNNLLQQNLHPELNNLDYLKDESLLPLVIIEQDDKGIPLDTIASAMKELQYLITNICRLSNIDKNTTHYIKLIESGSDVFFVVAGTTLVTKVLRKVFEDIEAIVQSVYKIRTAKEYLTAKQLENAYSSLQLMERLSTFEELKLDSTSISEEDIKRLHSSVVNLVLKGVGAFDKDIKSLEAYKKLLPLGNTSEESSDLNDSDSDDNSPS